MTFCTKVLPGDEIVLNGAHFVVTKRTQMNIKNDVNLIVLDRDGNIKTKRTKETEE